LDLQASAGSLSNKCHTTHYLVPNRRVREFVGREDVLSKIELGFTSSRTIVMRGLGGQGKTQVALEYCRRAKAHGVRMILWVDASSENSVNKNFETISESIKDSYEILQDETRVKFVMDTLEAWPEPWVMVFDNYDDPSAFNIQDYIPDTINGHILVTSRHADTEYLTDPEFAIELQGLPMQDALHLLLKQSRFAHTESNIQHGELVVKRLGYHALAITQAGSYIQLRKIKLEEFFDNYNKQLNRMEMFNQTPQMSQYRRKLSESAKETALNVFTTWELSFQQLQEQEAPNLQKSQVLTLFAFFDCKVISERLFQSYFLRNGLNNDQEGLIQSLFGSFTGTQNEWHHQAFVQSLSDLAQMSLIQAWSRDEEGLCQLSLHPLIKDWIRLRTDIVSFQNYMIITAWILADRLESCRRHNQFEMSLSNKQALLSHLDAYKENFESLKLGLSQSAFEALYDELETAEDWFSDFLRFNGSLTEAEAICRRLTVWRETNFGFQNEGPLSSLGDLALVLEDQGKYGESEEIILRVLDQRQNVLGRDHLDTLVSLHNLAFLLGRQSKYGEAETLTRLVLSHRQRRLGQDHPEVLTSLNNLALLLNCQGKYQVAEVINRAVLQCREVVLGHNHLDTITSMNNLGIDLRVQARSEEAEKLLQRALLHSETELGSEHPDTLCTIWNLAVLKEDQRKYDEALAYFERACRGCKKVLGPEHPDTLRCEEGYLQVLEERRIMEC
jgi:tetratricopeptide (TPR) repeat protein